MSSASRGAVAVLLAVLLVVGVGAAFAVGPAAADQHDDESANETVERATGPYDLETLEQGGTLPQNAPPSTRAMGSTTNLWVEYAPTGFMRSSDREDREDLERGTDVRRDTIWLGSSRGWNAEQLDLELKIVYYKIGEITRTTSEGQTYTERAAVNQTVDTVDVSLASGYDYQEIDLRRTDDDEKMAVAMFVVGHEGDVQWQFNQVSTPASASADVSSLADMISWAFLWMFLPFAIVLGGVLWADRKILERAGAGPQYKTSEYVGLAFFAGFFALLFAYEWIIDLVARAPWAVGIVAGLGFGLLVVEMFGDNTYKDLFVRFDLEDVETREDGSGIQRVEAVEKKMVDLETGETGVVRDGLRAFVARARGAVPTLDTGPLRRETQLEVEGKWRNLHLVDPSAEGALEYEPAKWELDVVDFDREVEDDDPTWLSMLPKVDVLPVLVGVGVLYAGYALSQHYLGTGVVGFLVAGAGVLAYWARPVEGTARTRLAPVHFDAVVSNVLTMAKGLEEAADRDYYRKRYHEEQGKNLAKRSAEREENEQSRMGELMERLAPDDDDLADGRTPTGADDD